MLKILHEGEEKKKLHTKVFRDRHATKSMRINKLVSVFHASVPVIDHEFRHNIVKVAVDPRGDRRVKIKSKHEKNKRQKCEKLQSDASNIVSLSHKL